jgi:hypothetical protein
MSSESDFEAFRKKRRQHQKKKKDKQEKKTVKTSGGRETQRYAGNKDKIAKLISKLSKMSIEDPEYVPTYYNCMVMDQSRVWRSVSSHLN